MLCLSRHRLFDCLRVTFLPLVLSGLWGCSTTYQTYHHSNVLRLHDNRPDREPPDFNPQWAEMVVNKLSEEFGIGIEQVAPVHVYIDCDSGSDTQSHFNRLTKSVVLKRGQAELSFLFLHEVTHLFLDQLDGSPPYWVDQGLAGYMESRAHIGPGHSEMGLVPPFLELPVEDVRSIGEATSAEVRRHLSREAIDSGASWAAPLLHYLLRHRWVEWPLSSRISQLTALRSADLIEIVPGFQAYCRSFNPLEEFFQDYRQSDDGSRLLLLSAVGWRFPTQHRTLLKKLHDGEEDALWRLFLAKLIDWEEKEEKEELDL